MAEGGKELLDFDGKPHVIYGEDRKEDYIKEDYRKEDEDIFNDDDMFKKEGTTSTSRGAKPKVETLNYDEMLLEHNREYVKNNFPEMKDVIVRQMGGKIQISIYGSNEWINFKKSNGKINAFSGELKKALGPPLKKLESYYFIELKRIFPLMNEKEFEIIYEKDKFKIRLRGGKNKGETLFKKGGEFKLITGKKLRNKLGPLAEDVVSEKKQVNELDQSKIDEIDDELKNTELDDVQIENLNNEKSILEERIDEREEMIENTEAQMKLKDRIKAILKKHGLTIITVTSAIVTVISAIVSNLRIGLSKLAKNLGNGLKEIGKKLATILPGMVGAIASFIFRTAVDVIGFLSKNAWLLIIAVVVAVVDRFKKNK